jgi:hypothetical protein
MKWNNKPKHIKGYDSEIIVPTDGRCLTIIICYNWKEKKKKKKEKKERIKIK